MPHARGPILLGVEDMGLQDGKGVEVSLGTEGDPAVSDAPAAAAENPSSEALAKTESNVDNDGDIVLGDPKSNEEVKEESSATSSQLETAESEVTGESSQAPDAKKET